MDILLELLNDHTLLRSLNSYQPVDFYIHHLDHTFSVIWVFISEKDHYTYRNGLRHSYYDLPAIECSNGYKAWYQHGEYHRDNGLPAVECPNGTKYWYQYGKYRRDNRKNLQ